MELVAVNTLKLKPMLKLKLSASVPLKVVQPLKEARPLAKSGSTTTPKQEPASAKPKISRRAVLRTLVERYPNCFKSKGELKLPLKVGIDVNILGLSPDLPPRMLQVCLAHYVSAPGYRKAVIEGAIRVDLNGNPAGIVTAGEAAHAAEKALVTDSNG